MSEWDYEVSGPMAGGVYRIRARAEKDGTVSQLILETLYYEQNDVITVYHHDGRVLLQYARGPKHGKPEIRAVAIFQLRPGRQDFWLNLESLKEMVKKRGFAETWRFIKSDLEEILIHSFRL